jgi:hypothetical protein
MHGTIVASCVVVHCVFVLACVISKNVTQLYASPAVWFGASVPVPF